MTIEQTIEVPVSRRIYFDLPSELPIGKARVELTFIPLSDISGTKGGEKIHLTKPMIEELMQGETLRSLTGILHTPISLDEIRAERLKKHDYIA